MAADRFAGVWLLGPGEGVMMLTADGWYSVVTEGGASAGHYGVDGDRFLLDPVVPADRAGHVERCTWSFDTDVLVLAADDGATQRWHRDAGEVVTGLGVE